MLLPLRTRLYYHLSLSLSLSRCVALESNGSTLSSKILFVGSLFVSLRRSQVRANLRAYVAYASTRGEKDFRIPRARTTYHEYAVYLSHAIGALCNYSLVAIQRIINTSYVSKHVREVAGTFNISLRRSRALSLSPSRPRQAPTSFRDSLPRRSPSFEEDSSLPFSFLSVSSSVFRQISPRRVARDERAPRQSLAVSRGFKS